MRSYKVKGEEHFIYDLESELPDNIHPIKNWRDGLPGDWVLADDNAYVQILERKKIGKNEGVRTCVGTYMVTQTMDTAERDSRYTINGKLDRNTVQERKKPTDKEVIFASKIVRGADAVKAYMEVYRSNNANHAKRRSALLLKTERINTLMNPTKEELTEVFASLDVDLKFLIREAKDQVIDGKNGSDKMNALKMLWEAFGVVTQKKVTEVAGIFQGFEPAQLKEVKRPSLPEHQSTGDEVI
jgi:hypothetical protein